MNQENDRADYLLERAMEALYCCARQYGQDNNLELKAKYLEEAKGKDILAEWQFLGDPSNPHEDDTIVGTFFLNTETNHDNSNPSNNPMVQRDEATPDV